MTRPGVEPYCAPVLGIDPDSEWHVGWYVAEDGDPGGWQDTAMTTPDDASVPPDVLAALREIQRLVGVVVPSLITEVETGAQHAAVITIPLNATGSGCAVTANNFAGLTNTFWTSLTPEQIATIRQWRARRKAAAATAVVGVATADHIDRFEGLLAFVERIIPLNN